MTDLDAYWPKPGEDMDSFVARTDGLGVAASLRRAAWVTGKPLGEIVAWWDGLLRDYPDKCGADGCHGCREPTTSRMKR